MLFESAPWWISAPLRVKFTVWLKVLMYREVSPEHKYDLDLFMFNI